MKTPDESQERDLRERLRALRVDPPDGGFSLSLHRRLAAAEPPVEPSLWRRLRPRLAGVPAMLWPLLWPAAGVAAGILVFLALGLAQTQKKPSLAPSPGAIAVTRLPATKVAMVRVNLSAEVAVENAEIHVSLPPGLVFWADGQELAQHDFEWTQPLSAGDNDIPIAVRGLTPGKYRMTVSARIGNERVEDEVLIEVVDG